MPVEFPQELFERFADVENINDLKDEDVMETIDDLSELLEKFVEKENLNDMSPNFTTKLLSRIGVTKIKKMGEFDDVGKLIKIQTIELETSKLVIN